jgi:hypothetical protein
MPYVGQLVTKQTWLLDNVVIRGIAQQESAFGGTWKSIGEDVGADDWFDLLPDANYQHLVAMFSGNTKYAGGCIHLETYPIPNVQINHVAPWVLPSYWLPPSRAFLTARRGVRQIRQARAPYIAPARRSPGRLPGSPPSRAFLTARPGVRQIHQARAPYIAQARRSPGTSYISSRPAPSFITARQLRWAQAPYKA